MAKRLLSLFLVLAWLPVACMVSNHTGPDLIFAATSADYEAQPPFVASGVPPLVMLVMGRNHKLYYEAYNDASDLNPEDDDGLDIGYNPSIDYYGYFDSYKCYTYNSSADVFEPSSVTDDKTTNAADEWSGDYLNYLTMSRMDCMRKVLYGGYRSTDTATKTVLERAFIPQDAHSWGKEYHSVAYDGYDIRDYTPFSLPETGTRHLFANTTLDANGNGDGSDDPPLLRYALDNSHRIWEWVAKESPVCDNSIEISGGTDSHHPDSLTEYDVLVDTFANANHEYDSGQVSEINGSGNPYGSDENYLTIFEGTLQITDAGTYEFAIDGDDALELIIDGQVVAYWLGGHGRCSCYTYTGSIYLDAGSHTLEFRHEEVSGEDNYYLYWQKPGDADWSLVPSAADASTPGFTSLTQTTYDRELPSSTITDLEVRVEVCDPSVGVEANSKLYPDGVYKPVGILQRHGESDRMYFGLLTGSYDNNTSGGILRKNISSIRDEINLNTGEFLYQDDSSVEGIIKTIDLLRIVGYNYSSDEYDENCGWIVDHALDEGECRMWGNPVGEMMYETLRYFSGAASPTSDYTDATTTDDADLGLPNPAWRDPYLDEDTNGNGVLDSGEDTNGNGVLDGYDYCAKPFMLVLSDIYPNYDSDELPGSPFGSVSSSLGSLDVEALGQQISGEEIAAGNYFIGESSSSNYDNACSSKNVSGFGYLRGLCPEEPTKQGSYYAASVAYYGNKEDLHSASEAQKVGSYCVGLASPLPEINIQVGQKTVRLVPFGKSVGGGAYGSTIDTDGDFQPTNTIVDFFVEEISETYGKFRINFEDVEQGADHDMDAIVEYVYQVVDSSGTPVVDPANGESVEVTLNSTYASGSIIQHLGYIISGTTQDGTYLEVRDEDTGTSSDVDYHMDTPPGELPGGNWDDDTHLPLLATRTFTPGDTSASLLTNPLWYAAKWGGFEDSNAPDDTTGYEPIPDLQDEWDKDGDGSPDTYFYVQNPLKLEEQLNASFKRLLDETSSGSAASVISQTRSGEGAVYQAIFYPEYTDSVKWTGDVRALFVDSQGHMREDTNGNNQLDLMPEDATDPQQDRIVVFEESTVTKYLDANGDYELEDSEIVSANGDMADVEYLWTAAEWLNEMSDSEAVTQRVETAYTDAGANRYIFTFADQDQDMVVDSGEQVDFVYPSTDPTDLTDASTIYPYINLFPTFGDEPSLFYDGSETSVDALRAESTVFSDFLTNQTRRVINYIRGKDQPRFTSSTSPSYMLPPFRSRQVDYDEDGAVETWRLGDIVYSTPTAVGRPAEGYHLLYRDDSYADYRAAYEDRRTVVYAGANDGMFHAFNGGFYDSSERKFYKTSDGSGEDGALPLGAEIWAYVPYNLLPHLYWLTELNYPHVYYCDLKPKVFDAKILPDDTHYSDTDTEPNWGTFLVGGMRFGGGEIIADMDKTDGNTPDQDGTAPDDRSMTSAYFILDITDPESPPEVIAEFSFDGLGYTTCYPAVVPMKDKDNNGNINANEWYLVFGSGPADADGKPGTLDSLGQAVSGQSAKLFVVDLKKLASDGVLETLDSTGTFTELSSGDAHYQSLDSNAFISDPISVDYDLNYSADALYFGTVEGSSSAGWGGKLRRVRIEDDTNPVNWTGDSTLMDLTAIGQPVTAAPTAAIDDRGRRWVYFGTGRFFVNQDKENIDQQSYYGIIEPFSDDDGDGFMDFAAGEELTWAEVSSSSLLDVSSAEVYSNRTVNNVSGVSNWSDLTNTINSSSTGGWFLDFPGGTERNLGQATLLGELLTFTSYLPSTDICAAEGTSRLYAVYYKTGTAYFRDVIGSDEIDDDLYERKRMVELGNGLAVSPNIHVGREEGSKAFVQTSTGDIKVIQEVNPNLPKSGVKGWREME